MKPRFFQGLLLVCLWAVSVRAHSPDPAVQAEAAEKPAETDRRVDTVRAEHPIQSSALVDAGLASLEEDLRTATTLQDTEGLSTCLKLLEQLWAQAVAAHDVNAINRIEADDFVGTDPRGTVTHKPDDLEAARSDALRLTDFKLEDVKVNLYDGNAVLTGTTTFSGTAHDQTFGGSYRWTDVFVERDGRWQVVISQATTIAPPDAPVPASAPTPPAPPIVNDADTLEKLEQDWGEAIACHDVDFLERTEADDYTYTGPDGIVSHKPDEIAGARAGFAQIESFKHRDIKSQVYGDTAVVTGATTLKGTAGDTDLGGEFRWTDVFVRRDGRWQVVASQATAIGKPDATD